MENAENDDATVGTILTRRAALRWAAGGVSMVAWFLGSGNRAADAAAAAEISRKACGTVKLVAAPAVTEGPFFVDEKMNRSDLRAAGAKRPSVAGGVPLALELTLYRLQKGVFAPLHGATVDLWHADASGVYSDENVPMNHENTAGQKWLRGYQVSGKEGIVRFETILPGWYDGRTTHIHFKVRLADGSGKKTREFTSQLFFDDAFADKIFAHGAPYRVRDADSVRNGSDNIFSERLADGARAGDHLLLDPKPTRGGKGYTASFAIALTDDNLRVVGGEERRGPFGGGPGDPGGPPPDGFGGGPPPPPGF